MLRAYNLLTLVVIISIFSGINSLWAASSDTPTSYSDEPACKVKSVQTYPATFENLFSSPSGNWPAPGFDGLDQINVQLLPSLVGAGSVNVVVTDGPSSNAVTIAIQ